MTTRKRRIRQEWARNLARPQVREGVRMATAAADAPTPNGIEADLYIYDVIDSWGGDWGVSAMEVVDLLNGFDGDVLNVRLNSPGGDYFEGVAILNALQRHSATVNVYVDGMAASAASVIAMAGDRRVMGLGAQLMIHEASTLAMGTAGDMRKTADMLDQTNDDIAALYASCVGGEADAFRLQMAAETWFTAATALECGLATEMAKKAEPVASDEDDEEDEDEPAEEGDDAEKEKAPPFKKKAEVEQPPVAAELEEDVAPVLDMAALRMALRPDVSRETTDSTAHPGGRPTASVDGFDPELIRSAIRKAT